MVKSCSDNFDAFNVGAGPEYDNLLVSHATADAAKVDQGGIIFHKWYKYSLIQITSIVVDL